MLAAFIEEACRVNQGSVIWITGLSGAGKTTIARHIAASLRTRGEPVILLDGDELRTVFDGGDRYDREARLALALCYGRLCQMLAAQGHRVICATISMRREVYAWNRANLPGYVEVFLDVDPAVRQARDPKRHYERASHGALPDFAGLDQSVDYPADADIHLTPQAGDSTDATAAEVLARLDSMDRARRDHAPALAMTPPDDKATAAEAA